MKVQRKPFLLIATLVLFVGTFMFTYLSMHSDATAIEEQFQAGDTSNPTSVSPRRFIMFNDRLQPDEESEPFLVPSQKILIITDVIIQNRAPGDMPVDGSVFSRVVLGQFLTNEGDMRPEQDIFFTVVGNDSLNLHFTTGMQVPSGFRVLNVTNSTAPFIEFTITGFLVTR